MYCHHHFLIYIFLNNNNNNKHKSLKGNSKNTNLIYHFLISSSESVGMLLSMPQNIFQDLSLNLLNKKHPV